jgi:hypothetical protein
MEAKGVVDLARSGSVIFKILSDMKLTHMWDALNKALGSETTISRTLFVSVFLSWMGIDEQLELQCQQGVLSMSVLTPALHSFLVVRCA